MKKHLSVLMLLVRSSFYKLLALLAAMAAVQTALFYLALRAEPELALPALFSKGRTGLICGAAFVLYTAVLCLTGCELGSKQGYTLRRLSISERSVYFWQVGYNLCCYLLFWFVQLAAVLFISRLRMAHTGGPQDVYLMFYQNSFLHSVLPLDETSRYVRNAAMVVAMGCVTAYFPLCQRRGGFAISTVFMTGVTVCFFAAGLGACGRDVVVILLSVLFASTAVGKSVTGRRGDED